MLALHFYNFFLTNKRYLRVDTYRGAYHLHVFAPRNVTSISYHIPQLYKRTARIIISFPQNTRYIHSCAAAELPRKVKNEKLQRPRIYPLLNLSSNPRVLTHRNLSLLYFATYFHIVASSFPSSHSL